MVERPLVLVLHEVGVAAISPRSPSLPRPRGSRVTFHPAIPAPSPRKPNPARHRSRRTPPSLRRVASFRPLSSSPQTIIQNSKRGDRVAVSFAEEPSSITLLIMILDRHRASQPRAGRSVGRGHVRQQAKWTSSANATPCHATRLETPSAGLQNPPTPARSSGEGGGAASRQRCQFVHSLASSTGIGSLSRRHRFERRPCRTHSLRQPLHQSLLLRPRSLLRLRHGRSQSETYPAGP